MKNSMITKVQHKNDKLLIKWEEIRNGHRDKKSIETRVEPHRDFFTALMALDKPLCTEAELPLSEDEYKRHDIQSIMCEYDEDSSGNIVMSVSITSERHMEGISETMKIVSPMKPETGEFAIESETKEKVYALIEEAEKYLDGKRHDLFSVGNGLTEEQKQAIGN